MANLSDLLIPILANGEAPPRFYVSSNNLMFPEDTYAYLNVSGQVAGALSLGEDMHQGSEIALATALFLSVPAEL
jgi:hypothetical protein